MRGTSPLLARRVEEVARLRVFEFLLSNRQSCLINDPDWVLEGYVLSALFRSLGCQSVDFYLPFDRVETEAARKIRNLIELRQNTVVPTITDLRDRVVLLLQRRAKDGLAVLGADREVGAAVDEMLKLCATLPPAVKLIYLAATDEDRKIGDNRNWAFRIDVTDENLNISNSVFAELVDYELQWKSRQLQLSPTYVATVDDGTNELFGDALEAQRELSPETIEALVASNASFALVRECERYKGFIARDELGASELDSRGRVIVRLAQSEMSDWTELAKAKFAEWTRTHAKLLIAHPNHRKFAELVRASMTGLSLPRNVLEELIGALKEGEASGIVSGEVVEIVERERVAATRTDAEGGAIVRGVAEKIDKIFREIPDVDKRIDSVSHLIGRFGDAIDYLRGMGVL